MEKGTLAIPYIVTVNLTSRCVIISQKVQPHYVKQPLGSKAELQVLYMLRQLWLTESPNRALNTLKGGGCEEGNQPQIFLLQ